MSYKEIRSEIFLSLVRIRRDYKNKTESFWAGFKFGFWNGYKSSDSFFGFKRPRQGIDLIEDELNKLGKRELSKYKHKVVRELIKMLAYAPQWELLKNSKVIKKVGTLNDTYGEDKLGQFSEYRDISTNESFIVEKSIILRMIYVLLGINPYRDEPTLFDDSNSFLFSMHRNINLEGNKLISRFQKIIDIINFEVLKVEELVEKHRKNHFKQYEGLLELDQAAAFSSLSKKDHEESIKKEVINDLENLKKDKNSKLMSPEEIGQHYILEFLCTKMISCIADAIDLIEAKFSIWNYTHTYSPEIRLGTEYYSDSKENTLSENTICDLLGLEWSSFKNKIRTSNLQPLKISPIKEENWTKASQEYFDTNSVMYDTDSVIEWFEKINIDTSLKNEAKEIDYDFFRLDEFLEEMEYRKVNEISEYNVSTAKKLLRLEAKGNVVFHHKSQKTDKTDEDNKESDKTPRVFFKDENKTEQEIKQIKTEITLLKSSIDEIKSKTDSILKKL